MNGDLFDSTLDISDAAAEFTYKKEAQLNKEGKLKIYATPSNDGGGKYEVAGINSRYHPEKFEELKNLINQ